jgi:hypothetical protein
MASNPIGGVSAVIRDIKPDLAELDAINARVDRATLAAMKAAQQAAKVQVKSGMRGRPRWDKRGAIGRNKTVPAVNLNLTPHHVSKSGGPGMLTGHLRGAVGAVKRPKKKGRAGYSGGVGVGGPKSITLLYRNEVEGRAPYMRPGVKKAERKMSAIWERAWGKAMSK